MDGIAQRLVFHSIELECYGGECSQGTKSHFVRYKPIWLLGSRGSHGRLRSMYKLC
jgi:hypothetical protein